MQGIGVAFGRFNPLSREHEKLLSALNSLNVDVRFVFVFGKDESPLSLADRVIYIRWRYPEIEVHDSRERYCENIPSCLINLYQRFPNNELHLVGGTGKSGISETSKVGGSIEEMRRIIFNFQGTKFKNEPDKCRMNWKSVHYHAIKRGEWSGTRVRNYMRTLDCNNPEHIESLRSLLHSEMGFEETWRILKLFKDKISNT